MNEKKPHDYTMREQLEGLMQDNIEKYPDAIDWIRVQMEGRDLSKVYTRKEKFVRVLAGKIEGFEEHPYKPGTGTYIQLIKWYRERHDAGLKEAKEACDRFILEEYGIDTPGCR